MIRRFLRSLLPEYANKSLGLFKRWIISRWMKVDSTARAESQSLQHLREAVNTQPFTTPSADVSRRIQAVLQNSTRSSVQPGFWKAWAGGMALILLSIILLWNVMPPGIILQWSVQGGQPVTNRVYRADTTLGTGDFELVYEIPTAPDTQVYTFKDFLLIPGKEYVYRVEVIDRNGLASDSQTVTSNANEALPGQLALLVSLIITTYGISLVVKKPKLQPLQVV